MPLFTSEALLERGRRFGVLDFQGTLDETRLRLEAESKSKIHGDSFDIFLSHSFEDRLQVGILYKLLSEQGISVYVDWICDPWLDRQNVTKSTATIMKLRMQQSKSLVYCSSLNSRVSKWMPWELGYADGKLGRVAVLPIVKNSSDDFKGVEYLGIYPYISYIEHLGRFPLFVEEERDTWVVFTEWLKGVNPSKRVV